VKPQVPVPVHVYRRPFIFFYFFAPHSAGIFLGPPTSLVAIGDAMPEAYASVGLIVTIRKNRLYSPLGVGDAFDNLPNGHILRGVHISIEGTKVLGGGIGYIRFCSRRVRNGLK
jgi:hypothetical protein